MPNSPCNSLLCGPILDPSTHPITLACSMASFGTPAAFAICQHTINGTAEALTVPPPSRSAVLWQVATIPSPRTIHTTHCQRMRQSLLVGLVLIYAIRIIRHGRFRLCRLFLLTKKQSSLPPLLLANCWPIPFELDNQIVEFISASSIYNLLVPWLQRSANTQEQACPSTIHLSCASSRRNDRSRNEQQTKR